MYSIPFLDIPALHSVGGEVRLPGSKSISNRVLLLTALCAGKTRVQGVLDSDDTQVMMQALQALGCDLLRESDDLWVTGLGCGGGQRGRLSEQADLFLGNAGTAMRPLAAALAVLGGDFHLHGVPRMHERPIADLVTALQQLGCDIQYGAQQGFPPLRIGMATTLRLDQAIRVRGDVSSQFLTALLMALPLISHLGAIVVEVEGELISKPYIEITLRLMEQFGVVVQREGWQRFTVLPDSHYRSPGEIAIEADASSASYFIAAGALAASAQQPLRIEGVGAASIQGDIRFIEAAAQMGAVITSGAQHLLVHRGAWPLRAIDIDANHIPDAAMTLAVMALYAEGTTTIRNIASWRVKETDRIHAMRIELTKVGAIVEEGLDFIRITPPPQGYWQRASIATYDDHRMAMCFSLLALHSPCGGIRIEEPHCVAKTFPDYFEALFAVAQSAAIPVIAIDGPSASGKGTLAQELARRLGFHYLDSGALYRMVAWGAQRAGIDWGDAPALCAWVDRVTMRFEGEAIFIDEQEVSVAIRSEAMGLGASQVSVHPALRDRLLSVQRAMRKLPGLVADGRDMASVVFPDAALKVFLSADATCRATRRSAQLHARGEQANYDTILQDLQQRDARDRNRAVAPLHATEDAHILDNSQMGVPESLAQVCLWWDQTITP